MERGKKPNRGRRPLRPIRYKPNHATRRGDLWQLGRHRLLCGDSTNAADVQRLFGHRRPLVCVTDPPYGVSYDPAWRNRELGQTSRALGVVHNDDRVDWTDAYRLFPGNVLYVWHSGRYAADVAAHLRGACFEIRAQIIWSKHRFAISRGHYHWQHEPCWYAVRKGTSASWAGDRKQRTVWPIKPGELDGRTIHSAQKPIECMARAIANHGDQASYVYDPFVGAGSTLLAAELLERPCLAMEVSPEYCDLVIERWQSLAGRRARLL